VAELKKYFTTSFVCGKKRALMSPYSWLFQNCRGSCRTGIIKFNDEFKHRRGPKRDWAMFIRLVKKLFKNLVSITKSLQILDNVEKNYCGLLIGRKLVHYLTDWNQNRRKGKFIVLVVLKTINLFAIECVCYCFIFLCNAN